MLGCSPPAPVETSDGASSTDAEVSSGQPSTETSTTVASTGMSVDETGCAAGLAGCACTPEGDCDEGSACDDGECVVLADACGDGVVDPGEDCDDGNLTDADGCNADCTPSGARRWAIDHQPAGVIDSCARAVTIDSADAIAVAGYEARGLGETIWVTKLGPDGSTLWSDPALESGEASAIAVDTFDRFVVAGSFGLSVGDTFARIYDGDGTIVATVSTPLTWARAAAVSSAAEALVAGGSELRAYDDGPGWGLDLDGFAQALAASPRGGFAVAGWQSKGGFSDAWVAWHSGNAPASWVHTSEDSPYDDRVGGVALDGEGNIVLAGFVVQDGSRDVWVRKLGPDGAVMWTQTHHSGDTQGDEAYAVATDAHDRIVVVGYEGRIGDEDTEDIWIRKYDPQGQPLWTATHAGAADDSDYARGVAIDSSDGIVVVGCVGIGGFDTHAWIAKYSP